MQQSFSEPPSRSDQSVAWKTSNYRTSLATVGCNPEQSQTNRWKSLRKRCWLTWETSQPQSTQKSSIADGALSTPCHSSISQKIRISTTHIDMPLRRRHERAASLGTLKLTISAGIFSFTLHSRFNCSSVCLFSAVCGGRAVTVVWESHFRERQSAIEIYIADCIVAGIVI